MIGEVRLADVLVAPSPDAGKEVFRLADWSPALGRWAADRAIKVSTHFAVLRYFPRLVAIIRRVSSRFGMAYR